MPSGGPPPPAPPRAAASKPPAPSGGDGRGDLLASIRGAGVGSLKRVQKEPAAASPAPPPADGGDDLAAALRSALNRRKGAVGDSGIDLRVFESHLDRL